MYDAFGDSFPIKVSRFLDQVHILKKYRSTLSCREEVLVVGNRNPLVRRQGFFAMIDQGKIAIVLLIRLDQNRKLNPVTPHISETGKNTDEISGL